MIHQVLAIPIIGKFVAATALYFKLAQPSEIPESLVFVSEPSSVGKDKNTASVTQRNSDSHIENLQNGSFKENTALLKEQNGILPSREMTDASNGHIKKA